MKSLSVAFIVATLQLTLAHVIIYFLSFFFIFCFTDCHFLSLFLKSGVTLSPYLLCVSPLTQTLEMPLLYGILIVTDRLQPPHLLTSHFFSYKFSIVLSLQIDWYGLQRDSFLSVFSVLSIMAQVCLPMPNQMSVRDR